MDRTNNQTHQSNQSTSNNSNLAPTVGPFPTYNGGIPGGFSMLDIHSTFSSMESLTSGFLPESSTSGLRLGDSSFSILDMEPQQLCDYQSPLLVLPAVEPILTPMEISKKRALVKRTGNLNNAPNDDELLATFKIPVPGVKILQNANKSNKRHAGGHTASWVITYGYVFRYKDSKNVIWTYCNFNRDLCKQANKTMGYQTGALIMHLATHGMNEDKGMAKKKRLPYNNRF